VLLKEYDSLQLTDRLLSANKTTTDLENLRTKAKTESENTWKLQGGLLLRYRKLYVPNVMLTASMLLRTAVIREVYDQPLTGHPRRTKLSKLIRSRYYWPGQASDIARYRDNCYICRRSHVPRNKKPGLLHQLPVLDRP
jgi:hypothetical protein